MMLLPNLPKSQYHPLWFRDDASIKSAKEPIPYIVIQRWCYYQICQRANTIHCDSEMMLLPNLPKSQYHPLWFRDDAITKSAKEPIASIVIQRWWYYQICPRANTIHCDSEMMILPKLPKSKYHPLWCRDNAVIKSAKEQKTSIVMQRWWYYQSCQRANTIHLVTEIMLLPNLPKIKYHNCFVFCLFDSLCPINNLSVI